MPELKAPPAERSEACEEELAKETGAQQKPTAPSAECEPRPGSA